MSEAVEKKRSQDTEESPSFSNSYRL